MATLLTPTREMPLPPHYDAAHASDDHYHPADIFQLQLAALKWRDQHQLQPASRDQEVIQVLLIDMQDDFTYMSGSLPVTGRSGTGAVDDSGRAAEFIYRNLNRISKVHTTLDSHLPYQVFFPSAHLKPDGTHPEPFTMITADDYRSGKYIANPAMAAQLGVPETWLQRQFKFYCEQLEASGKYALTLWPYHTMVGSHGHQLVGVVDEARYFHAFARGAMNQVWIKGTSPLTEHYSIFQAEVQMRWDGAPIPDVQKNVALLSILEKSDKVVLAGEAGSHCFNWSADDLLHHLMDNAPEMLRKVYILGDCTSPVVIPGVIDYTDDQMRALDRFQNLGAHVVNSTDPIDSWPS